jgi:hypothetical protein
VFTTESGTAFPVLERRSHNMCSDELVEACLTEESMEKRLSQLDGSKAMGNDGIHAYVLKQAAPGFARPIRMLLALSFRTSTIPSAWREANVTPIYKKGGRMDPANYRPVSLTSIVCKLLESIIRDVILNHLVTNKDSKHME